METIKSHFIILGFGTRPVEHLVRRACFIHFRKRILFENHKKTELTYSKVTISYEIILSPKLSTGRSLPVVLPVMVIRQKFVSPKEAVLISVGCFLCLFAADDVIVYKQQPFSVMRFILDSKL